MPKVDVLLPYWGDVNLLKKAVESVINQTESDWRLLVFDDCYPSDEPSKYFDQLSDNRILYVRHSKNLGITKNFNHSIKAARSQYCVIMGCDDVMLPDYLKRALSKIGDADFYQPKVEVINSEGEVYLPLGDRVKKLLRPKIAGIYEGERLAVSLCRGNWLYFPSIMWKTGTIQKYSFDERFKISQDVIVELSIIKDGGKLYVDDENTFQYRRFAGSLSSAEKSKDGIRFKEEAEVYKKMTGEFKSVGWGRAARAAKLRLTSRIHGIISR